MTHADLSRPTSTATVSGFIACTTRVVTAVIARVSDWYAERRAISALHALDDHMLHDIGITRGEIRAAVRGALHRR